MIWNIVSLWCTAVLFFKIFIAPMFIEDDSEEAIERMADEVMAYTEVCLAGIAISNICAMIF